MTAPISNERVIWLHERAKVLDECIRISSTQMYAMQGGGHQRDDLMNALKKFREERTAITIELVTLTEKFGVTP